MSFGTPPPEASIGVFLHDRQKTRQGIGIPLCGSNDLAVIFTLGRTKLRLGVIFDIVFDLSPPLANRRLAAQPKDQVT